MRKYRWTVTTDRGAFIVYAKTEANAKRLIQAQGHKVVSVRPRGYKPPTKPTTTN